MLGIFCCCCCERPVTRMPLVGGGGGSRLKLLFPGGGKGGVECGGGCSLDSPYVKNSQANPEQNSVSSISIPTYHTYLRAVLVQ